MQDADDQNIVVRRVDDDVRPVRVKANRRHEILTQSRQLWIRAEKRERSEKPVLIPLSLRRPEDSLTVEIDADDILVGLFGRPVFHARRAAARFRESWRISSSVRVLIPLFSP